MNNKTQNLSLIKNFLLKIRAKQITAHLHVQLRFMGSANFLSMHLKYAFASITEHFCGLYNQR